MESNIYSDLFIRILNISLVSCYTIVVVMVVRALILRWERKYAYLLWFVVFVSLCIPFRIVGPFSLVPAWIADFDVAGRDGNRIQAGDESKTDYLPSETITETVNVQHSYTSVEEAANSGLGSVPGTDSNSETTYTQGASESFSDYLPNETATETVSVQHFYTPVEETAGGGANSVPGTDSNSETAYYKNDCFGANSRKMLLAFVWGVGVILLTAGNVRAVLKLRGRLRSAEPLAGDSVPGECANESIMTADGIETPFLWGFISPIIYLPQTIDGEECTYIIAHECHHRKRKDYIFKPLFFMIAVIHWFNPLVWAAYVLFVRDMEISCDEAVIANADEDIRKKYAESLLKYAARQNGYTLTPITFGEPSLKYRIMNVLQYRKRNVMISAFILCAVIVVMAGLFFKPQKDTVIMSHSSQGNTQITQGISDTLAADHVDKGAASKEAMDGEAVNNETVYKANGQKTADLDITASQMGIGWKSGMIKGMDGENTYTKVLMESDIVSGEAADFYTFSYTDVSEMADLAGEEQQDGGWKGDGLQDRHNAIAYIMAGERTNGAITGSLWLVDVETKIVQPVMQNITMTDTQTASISFGDMAYIMINYQSGDRIDGRILPATRNALATEIMADFSGEKKIGDQEGTIVCNGYAYWLIDADTVKEVDGHDTSQDVEEWNPQTEYKRGSKADHYQIGQEYGLTDTEQKRISGLVPYYGEDMNAFFNYCNTTVTTKGGARRREAYAWINQIGRTESFDVYGTNLIDTMLVRTPDEKYLRIDHNFSSNYNEVPFLCEADFDADGEQELVIMGGFGYHGTGFYQEQLFIADRGADRIWRVYELHEDIYLPMIQRHMDSVYSEKGIELQIDGKGVGYFFANDEIVDASARYGAGAQIRFGYGEGGIVPRFASGEDRMLGEKDKLDKKIVLDAMLGVYSDTCVSGIFPGNHFVAEFTYEGDGVWSMSGYHHEFLDEFVD